MQDQLIEQQRKYDENCISDPKNKQLHPSHMKKSTNAEAEKHFMRPEDWKLDEKTLLDTAYLMLRLSSP